MQMLLIKSSYFMISNKSYWTKALTISLTGLDWSADVTDAIQICFNS